MNVSLKHCLAEIFYDFLKTKFEFYKDATLEIEQVKNQLTR